MTENRYRKLMHFVCVDHGYCGSVVDGKPLHVDDFIPDFGFVSAQQFAEWVMLADDCGPKSSPNFREDHKNNMVEAFIKYMGAESVYAMDLKWGADT